MQPNRTVSLGVIHTSHELTFAQIEQTNWNWNVFGTNSNSCPVWMCVLVEYGKNLQKNFCTGCDLWLCNAQDGRSYAFGVKPVSHHAHHSKRCFHTDQRKIKGSKWNYSKKISWAFCAQCERLYKFGATPFGVNNVYLLEGRTYVSSALNRHTLCDLCTLHRDRKGWHNDLRLVFLRALVECALCFSPPCELEQQ